PRRSDEVGIARDRPRQPVDVGWLEVGDLAERVAVELAENDLVRARGLDRRRGRWAEVALAAPVERAGRLGGAQRLALQAIRAHRRLPGRSRSRPGGGVPGTERGGGVDATGDGSGRAGRGGPGRPAVGAAVAARLARPAR